jgi:hypothetical protein
MVVEGGGSGLCNGLENHVTSGLCNGLENHVASGLCNGLENDVAGGLCNGLGNHVASGLCNGLGRRRTKADPAEEKEGFRHPPFYKVFEAGPHRKALPPYLSRLHDSSVPVCEYTIHRSKFPPA